MGIDIEVTTEQARDTLHKVLSEFGRGTKEVQEASEKLDSKILEEMLRQDPIIENQYLKRIQLHQNEQIRKLQGELDITNEKLRLAKEVVRLYQQGFDVKRALTVITAQAIRAGIM